MKIEDWKCERLKPYPNNPRIADRAVDAVAASIQAFGFRQPIVCDAKGVIVCGHSRWLAAKKLGLKTVPVHVATGLTAKQIAAYRLADNKTSELAQWNDELLAAELVAAQAGVIDMSAFGFSAQDLAGNAEVVEDEAPEPPAEPITKPGDLWILGNHRLLCGDSTKAEDVARVMGGKKIESVVTDPPYGIAHDTDYRRFSGKKGGFERSRQHLPIANDDKPFDPTPWLGFKTVVMWGGNCFSQRLPIGTWLVWDKRFANGKAILSDAEVAYMKGGHGVYIFSLTSQGCVRPEPVDHPTQKPVAVIAWAIEKSKAGPLVFDPFLGSGTTIIAAEQLGRRCYGLEIEPRYCDVILARWEKFTGRKAKLESQTKTVRPRKKARA